MAVSRLWLVAGVCWTGALLAGCGSPPAGQPSRVPETSFSTTGTTTAATTTTTVPAPPPMPSQPPPPPVPQTSARPPAPPRTTPKPPPPPPQPKTDRRYRTCKEAKANGLGPYYLGVDPEYHWYKDADHDGKVCE
ncbi:excalibur calcium-binding domain-containing protein [Crossiella sp. CA198]|uniref:excalibur calcium-binding domain-containing protein n=1 Tax=Crossiella sp. CA198 TaxID=3455607 RepID=UPI003F8D5BA5